MDDLVIMMGRMVRQHLKTTIETIEKQTDRRFLASAE